MEAAALGVFMLSACLFAGLLQAPASPAVHFLPNNFLRQALMGAAMGLTLLAIVYSPWGRRSGAHMNPAFTFNFYLLGKIQPWDALFYIIFQFLGGAVGVGFAWVIGKAAVSDPPVHFAVTAPGSRGIWVALVAEFLISGLLMYTVLRVSNSPRLTKWTPIFAASLVTLYITFEGPLSGMSMNPARTLGSAVWASTWTALWIYFVAPPLGMFVAAWIYRKQDAAHQIFCVKLHHHNQQRCIFNCNYGAIYES